MPWTCEACQQVVPLDDTPECPSCGHRKTAWTIGEQVRTLVVTTRKRFECLRGEGADPVVDGGAYVQDAWTPTDVLPALPAAAARALAQEGRLPAPRDVLTVREFPGGPTQRGPHPAGATDRDLTVVVEFAQRLAEERVLPGPAGALDAAGAVDARLVAVWGPAAGDVAFPGLAVLDVTEGDGFAPRVQVGALRRPRHALRVEGGPARKVYRARLTGLFFETNKNFLLPGAMPAIKRLKAFYDHHPGCQVLVVGHTDTYGRKDYNLRLSEERAAAIVAYLTDDTAPWEDRFDWKWAAEEKRWSMREVQWMLSALPDPAAPFYAGPINGQKDPPTRAALEAFQAWSNQTRGTSLPVDGLAEAPTRKELIAAYMAIDGTTLPAGTVLATHGCGEFHPEVDTGDEVRSEANRRVEVFFFEAEEGITPPPQRPCPAPGCAEYPQWREKVVEDIDLTVDPVQAGPLAAARLASLFTPRRTFPKPSAVDTLRTVAERMAFDPALRALIVGHTADVGQESDDVLRQLSLARALAVKAFLTGDAAYFRARFAQPDPLEAWDHEEVQWMLSALRFEGDPFYAGHVDGHASDVTFDALGDFQRVHGLPVTYLCDEPTLLALIAAYLALRAAPPVAPERIDVLGAGTGHAPRPFGRGAAPAADDGRAVVEARRVEVFLGPVIEPPATACPGSGTGCEAYHAWCDAVEEDFGPDPARPHVTVIQVQDALRIPLAGHPVAFVSIGPDGADTLVFTQALSANGCLEVRAAPGPYALELVVDGLRERFELDLEQDESAGYTARLTYPRAAAAELAALFAAAPTEA